ncbi:hypothetical protein ACQKCH_11055 [Nubsella zeaxanthinifaciens]|uniref:hypothetical protein n=1 Tax=Nubsella zeaxanthinifaciens TaxID=392412 RepID=UPI003D05B872
MNKNISTRKADQNVIVTAEKARRMLLEEGVQISLEEAQLVLDFLRILAKIVVKHYLKEHENSRFVREGKY